MTTNIPRIQFPRTDSASTEPHAFGRLDLCGSNLVKLVGFPLDVLEGLQPALRGDDGRGVLQVKKYTNEKGERTAVLTLLGKPWTTDAGNVSTDILLTVICGHLHKHLFYPTTGLPPPKASPPVHLSITFKRPLRVDANYPRTQSVFAVSLPTPTHIRTISVPEQAEQIVVSQILRLWGGEVREYRPLADGCYEIRLKQRARLFSSSSTGDNHTPLSALIEYLHSKGFPLIHSFQFHSKAPFPDFFLFDCPDGPVREDAEPVDPAYLTNVMRAPSNHADPYAVQEKKAKAVKADTHGPPTIQPKQGFFAFLRGRRSSNPTPAAQQAVAVAAVDLRSHHSLDSKRDASSFYGGRTESYRTRRNSEGNRVKDPTDIAVSQEGHRSPSVHANGLWPGESLGPRSAHSGAATPHTVLSHTMTDRKSKGRSVEIEEEPDVDSNWGGFAGEPVEGSSEPKEKKKKESKGKEKEGKSNRDKHKRVQDELPGIHQTMDNPAGKEGNEWGNAGNDPAWGWGGAENGNGNAGNGDAGNGNAGGGWGGTGQAIGGVGGGDWGTGAEAEHAGSPPANGWGGAEAAGADPNKWDTGTAVTVHNDATNQPAKSADTAQTGAPSKALIPKNDATLVPANTQKEEKRKERGSSKSGKDNKKAPKGGGPPAFHNPNDWSGPSAQPWDSAAGPYQGGKGTVTATRYNPSGSHSTNSPYWQPSEAVRDMDPRNGTQDVGGVIRGVYVPATRRLPATIEVNPIPYGPKKPTGNGGLFGPNMPTPEAAEAMRKEAEEKARVDREKLEEARRNAKWADAVAKVMQAEREGQLYLQSRGVNLGSYLKAHPELTFQGRMEQSLAPRWMTEQQPVPQKPKSKKKQDPYANYLQQYQEPAQNGYSYETGLMGPTEFATDWGGDTGGYDYSTGYAQDHVPQQMYAQDHVPQQKPKRKKGGQAQPEQQGYSWQPEGNTYGDPNAGQQPQPWYADGQNVNGYGASAGPEKNRRGSNAAPHIGWAEQQKGGRGKVKKEKGKSKRNFRDEELSPYDANGQPGWPGQGQADSHHNPAGQGHHQTAWGAEAAGQQWGEQGGQPGWGEQGGGAGGGGWGAVEGYGGNNGQEVRPWGAEARDNAAAGKQTISKGRGLRGILKSVFGGGKKKTDEWGNGGWPTAANAPAVNVQVETTHTQQPASAWGDWPVGDTGGGGGGGWNQNQHAPGPQANGHGLPAAQAHQGPGAHANGHGAPHILNGYGAPSVHQGQGGPWGGSQAAPSVHHGQGGWGAPSAAAGPAWPQQQQQQVEDQRWAALAQQQQQQQHPIAAALHGPQPIQGHVREPAGNYYATHENALMDSDEESYDDERMMQFGAAGMSLGQGQDMTALLVSKLAGLQEQQQGGAGGKALRRAATGRPRH
ncbi:hypothetical protein CALVIDRAFT_137772 [Calocera viscosa TUFC12733]|uniref:Uncharacterized protein n=1 Tax=Calocera viscosa (strain TUFC12733) TaxID=1330018 RepID=A0A167M037_CALVF|nr:hypothetical protein CALVIDRAFT_137772 [Calocera viscosa TUFC12733]